jgi:hypothetical protein
MVKPSITTHCLMTIGIILFDTVTFSRTLQNVLLFNIVTLNATYDNKSGVVMRSVVKLSVAAPLCQFVYVNSIKKRVIIYKQNWQL